MARRISAATVEAERPKRRSRYPWHKWSDGKWWEAKQGEDFDLKPEDFARTVNNHARAHGKKSETTIANGNVRFRIFAKDST